MLTAGLISAQNSLIRMPRISPNSQEMAFSFQVIFGFIILIQTTKKDNYS